MAESSVTEDELKNRIILNEPFDRDQMTFLLYLIKRGVRVGEVYIIKVMNDNQFEGCKGLYQFEKIEGFFELLCEKIVSKTYSKEGINIFKNLQIKNLSFFYEFDEEFYRECIK